MSTEEREVLEVDVVFVGAGPASLAGAYHLARLVARHNQTAAEKLEPSIVVLEKGAAIGSHALSGAIVDPRALRELFPETWQDAPFEAAVGRERFLWLTEKGSFALPTPRAVSHHGSYVASLGKLVRWIAPQVEEAGVDVFCEFPAVSVLYEGDRVVGVRTGDRGVSRDGEKKESYAPGVDIRAQVTVLGEGPRGTLTKQLDHRFDLWKGKNPPTYGIGIKEIWDVPAGRIEPGEVLHTVCWPLGFHNYGGGFVYGMQDHQVIVGLVAGLDYENPLFDPFAEFQLWKTHPAVRRLLEGGSMAFYGAKALPEGGWWSLPRLSGDGFLVVGDSAGFMNSQRLKGIHLGMKSGMLAAETIFEALRDGGATAERLAQFGPKVEASWIKDELWPVRNFHQAFDHGLVAGLVQTGVGMVTGGRGFGLKTRLETEPGHSRMIRLDSSAGRGLVPPAAAPPDGKLTFDRPTDLYASATAHDEDQPVHLLVDDPSICVTRCTAEYANPCQRFCPAAVYEIVDDASAPAGRRLQINASNCVHCKTCDIMDPYQIITWVPPEGGGGPNYSKM